MNNESELLSFWLKENPAAIELAQCWIAISQTWDDLYDGDKPVSKDQINSMMAMALIDIPKNPFFQQHCFELLPMVEHCLMTWLDANTLEATGDERDLQVSYIIRSTMTDLIIHMAGMVGGKLWRRKAALAIRKAIYHDNESFEDYQKEILAARELPEG